ncbi:MAG TPA: type IV pilus modification protein PilV [Candidatus Desulfobacillus sp.]|nr:type IV pilus modification protein PilV [Candidatus Desulfobacillus sp.]
MLIQDRQAGFSMIEVLIALLIFAFGILGMVGLQASSIRYQTDAGYRSEASVIAEEAVARIWVDRANLTGHLTAGTPIASLPGGSLKIEEIATDADSKTNRLRVTVNWTPPGDSAHSHVLIADVNEN